MGQDFLMEGLPTEARIVKGEEMDTAIQVSRQEAAPVRAGAHADHLAVRGVQESRLVVLDDPQLDIAVNTPKHHLSWPLRRPCDAGHWRRLHKLVANFLPITPF